MKVSDLTGAKLDYWVAKAEKMHNPKIWNFEEGDRCVFQKMSTHDVYSPSSDWSRGGPIINRLRIDLYHDRVHGGVFACKDDLIRDKKITEWGEDELIAAMRCFVASKFGDEVPDEPTS